MCVCVCVCVCVSEQSYTSAIFNEAASYRLRELGAPYYTYYAYVATTCTTHTILPFLLRLRELGAPNCAYYAYYAYNPYCVTVPTNP